MIAYIKGEITFKSPTFIVIEAGGIGYGAHISLFTYSKIEHQEKTTLYTYVHYKEDSQNLYGFADLEERKLFKHLISVSGVGPSTGQVVLSSLTPDQVSQAILSEDERVFSSVKGIGPKTAKRIILDLKDKIGKMSSTKVLTFQGKDNTSREEALSALVALGFNRSQAQKTIIELMKTGDQDWKVEDLIKESLRKLSGN